MTLTATLSRLVALAGLVTMTALLLWPAPTAWTGLVAVPLLVMLATGLKPPRKWGGWVAVFMVPYFCVALGEVIADPANYPAAALFAGGALVVFFAALDYTRRIGVSLRS